MTTTIAAPTLLANVEADLKAAGAWLLDKGEGLALTLWDIVKVGLVTLTQDQAQVVVNVLSRLDANALGGKSIEEIETAMLNEAIADELTVLKNVASATLEAVIAAFRASNI